jgi:hypothetical protein
LALWLHRKMRRSAGPCASISQQCRWEFGVEIGIG